MFLPRVMGHWAAFLLSGSLLSAAETARFNLSEKPTAPRFPLTDKKWPQKVGEVDLCLWHDDKLAALSLGVDDNFAGEIDWWKEQAALYDFKVTWFVITGRILKEGRSQGGLWSQFQDLENLGHAVESHTVTHLHVEDPGWGTPEWSLEKANQARGAALKAGREAAILAGTLKPEDGAPSVPAKPAASSEETAEGGMAARPSAESLTAARLAAADKPVTDPAVGVDWEYAQSIAQIESNLPGKKVSALAYPGGKNTVYNDRKIAAKHFRVARGATGAPNMANQTDYISTNALSNWNFDSTQGGNPYNVLDPARYNGRYYRGWIILFAHGVSANPDLFKKTFEFIKENRENLWVGLYSDVAKYGQERDTASLKVESAGPEKITFLLTDEMDDSYFNFPLTVKVRIPDEWKDVGATQADKPVTAKLLEHEGAAYALVQAVPDAGLVTVVKK
ncbi:MAG: polysaccharide deacetylase family protein [Terrimicrobiaceae bacterium]